MHTRSHAVGLTRPGGVGGVQMEAPHGSHAFKESRGEWGGTQTAHRWKGVGEGRCSGCHVPSSCTVLPNTDLDQSSEPLSFRVT